jgi:hypothetical protein
LKLRKTEVHPGKIVSRFSKEEAIVLANSWLSIFGEKPAPHMHDFMWHVFSYGSYPSVALQKAHDAYQNIASPEYVVLSNDRDEAFITDQKPTSSCFSDYYIFPKNLAWTMVFTHEDGWLGPFFAKHRDFEKLNHENLKKIMKIKEAAIAKTKGYW